MLLPMSKTRCQSLPPEIYEITNGKGSRRSSISGASAGIRPGGIRRIPAEQHQGSTQNELRLNRRAERAGKNARGFVPHDPDHS